MSYFTHIKQDVIADDSNSSSTPLSAGETFTGTSTSTLGVVGLQVSIKTDQNCTVYVDQSPDGTEWDISDAFEYVYSLGGDGWTVQAVNSYVRIRVTNTSVFDATYMRLQFVLCPIVEALPRSLSDHGRLKTESFISDAYNFHVENTPMGEQRVANIVKLVGTNFTGNTLDTNFISSSNSNGGTTTQGGGQITLATNTSPSGATVVWTNRAARYSAGSSMRYRAVVQLGDTGVSNNRRRWGIGYGATMPTITDGAFFSIEGTTFEISTIKGGSETKVTNGNFNGSLGETISIDTDVHTYEIYWTNSSVWFVIGDEILHKVTGATTTWTNTMTHYVGMDNVNTGISTNQLLYCRVLSIARMGPLTTQPTSKLQAGTVAANVCKYGAGNVHGLILSAIASNSVVTLYDNTTNSGTVLWSSGSLPLKSEPFELNMYDIPFSIGLTLSITVASSNVLVVYE